MVSQVLDAMQRLHTSSTWIEKKTLRNFTVRCEVCYLIPTFVLLKHVLEFCFSIMANKVLEQFLNKLRYAKEGARDMMDRACADLPWQVWLEVDGKDIEIPKVRCVFFIEVLFFPAFNTLTPERVHTNFIGTGF